MSDKLTIKFCEQMADGVKAIGDLRPLFRRLADIMQENERLKAKIEGMEGAPAVNEPYKHSDDSGHEMDVSMSRIIREGFASKVYSTKIFEKSHRLNCALPNDHEGECQDDPYLYGNN